MGKKAKAVNLSYKTFLQSKNGVILKIAEDVGLIFNITNENGRLIICLEVETDEPE